MLKQLVRGFRHLDIEETLEVLPLLTGLLRAVIKVSPSKNGKAPRIIISCMAQTIQIMVVYATLYCSFMVLDQVSMYNTEKLTQ